MSLVPTYLRNKLRQQVLARAGSGALDISQLDRGPPSLSWPLHRMGMDPVPQIAEVRTVEPVHKLVSFLGLTVWMVTGQAEARRVLADTAHYSNDIRPLVGRRGSTTDGDIGGLGFTDPPQHTRLRKLLTPQFTMRGLEILRPQIASIVEQQLDDMERHGPVVDLVQRFAFPIPFLVICELLGLPDADRDKIRQLGSARFDVSYGGQGTFGAVSASRRLLLESVRRQRTEPGDGLIGQIIREHGSEISDFDLADGVFTGGLETSASMLALGTAVLLDRSDDYRRLAEEPTTVDGTVEELLRYLSVVQISFPRFAKHDLELAGQQIHEGDVVICHLAGANRDPHTGAGLEDFNPARDPMAHLAFGHGFHRCVGAELARMELRTALPALAGRFPRLQLATEAHDLSFRQISIVYGVDSLPVRLESLTAQDSDA
jgi:cytochrome P450